MIQNGSAPGGNRPQRARGACGRHMAEPDETLGDALYPKRRVRIEDDVLGAFILKQREHLFAKLSPKLHVEPLVLLAGELSIISLAFLPVLPFVMWQQSDNVPFGQSRNVPLTPPRCGDAGRTTTDDPSRS